MIHFSVFPHPQIEEELLPWVRARGGFIADGVLAGSRAGGERGLFATVRFSIFAPLHITMSFHCHHEVFGFPTCPQQINADKQMR